MDQVVFAILGSLRSMSSSDLSGGAQVGRDLDLDPHILKRQLLHANGGHGWLMVGTILPKKLNQQATFRHIQRSEVSTDFVDLFPPFAAGFFQRMLDVVEYLGKLFVYFFGDLFRLTIPASWMGVCVSAYCGEHGAGDHACLPCPEISMKSPILTAWL